MAYVALEGVDGTGKTTLFNRLVQASKGLSDPIIFGTLPSAESSFYFPTRWEHYPPVSDVKRLAFFANTVAAVKDMRLKAYNASAPLMVTDRSAVSGLVYNCVTLFQREEMIAGYPDYIWPDVILHLAPPDDMVWAKRLKDKNEKFGLDKAKELNYTYLEMYKRLGVKFLVVTSDTIVSDLLAGLVWL